MSPGCPPGWPSDSVLPSNWAWLHVVPLAGSGAAKLSEAEAQKLWAQKQMPLAILDGKLRSAQLGPGEETVGVVEIKLPSSSPKARALRIDFSQDGRGPVAATLVL